MVVRRLYSGHVIVNDYLVPAVKCRDIPMVVRRLYSGNVIVNDYVVPDVKCRDIPMVVRRLCSLTITLPEQRRRTTIGISLHFTSGTT
jgi:hypothetical protein